MYFYLVRVGGNNNNRLSCDELYLDLTEVVTGVFSCPGFLSVMCTTIKKLEACYTKTTRGLHGTVVYNRTDTHCDFFGSFLRHPV